jgi:hypothetical protein
MYTIGSRIRRLWTDGNYYHGSVSQVSGDQIFVQFDDGDTAWLGMYEVEPEVPMGAPGMGGPGMNMKGQMGAPGMGGPGMNMKGQMGAPGMGGMYAMGQRVMAQWTDGGWYGATITQVGGPDNFFVTFDDGYTTWLSSYQIQPAGGMAMGFTVGMRVQKQWVDGAWYGGSILQVGNDGSYFVQFDDGDTAWVAGHELQPL